MVEYQEIFLKQIKALLLYFVEFHEDSTILPKEYLEDYTVNSSDQQSIIMIIYYKIHFRPIIVVKKFECWKDMEFFILKEKKKI